jgi:DNA polymerase elongation subunit (family B)
MLANQNLLPIGKSTSPVALTESLLFAEYFKNGFVVADVFEEIKTEISYEGGYVMDPIPGLYKDIACYDFASLYPSIMRQYNMSPESFLEKVDLTSESSFMKEKIEKYRNDESLTVSPSGAVFKIDKPSILKTILDKLYTQRRVYKKRMFEIEKHLDKFGIH